MSWNQTHAPVFVESFPKTPRTQSEATQFGGSHNYKTKQGVCHTLPFTLKSILRKKKNYGNTNISPCKNIISKNPSKRNQNPSRYHNSITRLKFQHKPKYHLSKILI
jgi:hypothetical protein